MHNDPLIILSNEGYQKMQFIDDFDKLMNKQGYENPFWREGQIAKQLFDKRNRKRTQKIIQHGEKVEQPTVLTPGKKYITKEEYIKRRNEYVTKRIYEEFGFDLALKEVENYKLYDLLETLRPCLTGDRQCSMLCPIFPCEGREEIINA